MKYLYLIFILVACNSSSEKAAPANDSRIDSLKLMANNVTDGLQSLDSLATQSINEVRGQIAKLKQENYVLRTKTNEPVYQELSTEYAELKKDDRDKTIQDLNKMLLAYKEENARLKKRIYNDSVSKTNVDRVVGKAEVEKPNDKSLVVTLDKRIKGDGEISDQGISVYIMPYNKKSKKLMHYDQSCPIWDLNSLSAIKAGYFNGLYFFNNVVPGKYIIKVCSYYGNYMVVEREDNYQSIAMKVSPPIQ